jgi:ATP-dependent RNA helicase HelY
MYREFPVTKIVSNLAGDNLLPAILFRTARRQCDEDIERLSLAAHLAISPDHQTEIRELAHQFIGKYGIEADVIFGHPQFPALLQCGAGAHHAGQLLHWRMLLEEIMSLGKLRLLVATGTVAAGVDFPARTVVITAHSKRGGEGFATLTAAEFQQMSGRAGRRGRDTVGLCVAAPGQFCDARVISQIADQPPEPLKSSYYAAPSTVLNLLKFRSVEELRYMVSKSLGAFHDRREAQDLRKESVEVEQRYANIPHEGPNTREVKKHLKRARRLERQASELETKQSEQLELALAGLRNLGHLDERGLTEKGSWSAELCTSLVLELSEAIAEGLFYDLDELSLAALIGSIAGDPYREYLSLGTCPVPKEQFALLREMIERVESLYNGQRVATEVVVNPHAAMTVISWMQASDWNSFASLLRLGGVSEGDAARLISQTADHLQQLTRLHETHTPLSQAAASARRIILRPPLSDAMIID